MNADLAYASHMALEALEHYTVNCINLEATRDFYRDVLGLSDGFRPKLPFGGYWLYAGDVPVVHLLGPDGALPENRGADQGGDTGSLDHIAFRGHDAQATIAKLRASGYTAPLHSLEDGVRDYVVNYLAR